MDNMEIDFSILEKALSKLVSAWDYCNSELAKSDVKLAEHLRSGAIQSFEFTYELTIKLLRRYLMNIESSDIVVRNMSFDELIRRCFNLEILHAEISVWRDFRRCRNITNHTYNENRAEEVMQKIPLFVQEITYLLDRIKK